MKVLIFAPHADDEVLGVGGTIHRMSRKGHQVHVCIVTVGDRSMFSVEMLDSLRKETIKAHELLGVEKTTFLELPAVRLNEIPISELNKNILKVVEETKPEIVFIPHEGDMHNDHSLVHRAAMVACRPFSGSSIKEVYAYETLSETEWNDPEASKAFIPNSYFDISFDTEKKMEAMSCFKTQLKEYPHPRSLRTIRALAEYRGSTVGIEYAEAFRLIRKIS